MTSRTTDKFWRLFDALPRDIQELARKNLALFQDDPHHPSLQFKDVGGYYSARVGIHYRVLCIDEDDNVLWFWIGPHAEYDKILARR